MVDQYLDRYQQKPKYSHESIKKGYTHDYLKDVHGFGLKLSKVEGESSNKKSSHSSKNTISNST